MVWCASDDPPAGKSERQYLGSWSAEKPNDGFFNKPVSIPPSNAHPWANVLNRNLADQRVSNEAFVHDHQIRHLHLIEPSNKRLNRGNLHLSGRGHVLSGLDQTMLDADGGESAGNLVKDLGTVGEDHDAKTLGDGALDDEGEQDRFPGTGWTHQKLPANTGPETSAEFLDQ